MPKTSAYKFLAIFAILILATSTILIGWRGYNYVTRFNDRVLPNTYIGDVNLGGMTQPEVKSFLQKMNDRLFSEGILVRFEANGSTNEFVLNPLIVVGQKGGNIIPLINTDIDKETQKIVGYKKTGLFNKTFELINNLRNKKKNKLNTISVDEKQTKKVLEDNVEKHEQKPKSAQLNINSTNPLDYSITTSSPGRVYDYENGIDQIKQQWSQLEMPEITLTKQTVQPDVTKEDIKNTINNLENVLSKQISITYTKDGIDYKWDISPNIYKDWLKVEKNTTTFKLVLDKQLAEKYLKDNIAPQIEEEAQNAKFEMTENNGQKRVTKFRPARVGLKLDIKQNVNQLSQIIAKRNQNKKVSSSVKLVVTEKQPDVTTKEVNNLGIEDKLGTGISDFSGSPQNRIHNIRIGVNKLDGMIIPPGEEFSAIEATKPYTRAAGYLSELVIKGEELKPEIGGGLCQIGTTLFRMAMESGMPITARRNHSLAVNYYTDPVNGNPGTDATIYNPQPDFKFKNTTDNHILIDTYMDTDKGKLYFTIWGKDDGRSKSTYTHPTVSQWFPPGKAKYKVTTSLAPGKMKCQKAHTGANASFTYKRVTPEGKTKERVFTSHYRPLPKICLVGVKSKCKKGEINQKNCNKTAVDILGDKTNKED